MSSLRFTAADRDDLGFVTTDPPPAASLRAIDPFDGPPRDLPRPAAADQADQRRRRRSPLALVAASLAALAILGIAAVALLGPIAGPRPLPTVAPARAAPPATPTTAPAPTTRPTPAPPAPTAAPPIAAFWAPGGDRAPDLAPQTPRTPTARYGTTWIAVALPGGGQVWIARSAAALDDAALQGLPDTAPAPTPLPARVVERPVEVVPPCAGAADIRFTTDRAVDVDGLPVGTVQGRSCYSQADADANAQLQADVMLTAWRQAHNK